MEDRLLYKTPTKKLRGVIVGGEVRFDLTESQLVRSGGVNRVAPSWGNVSKPHMLTIRSDDNRRPEPPWYSFY